MTPAGRWLVVAALAIAVTSAPLVSRALPARQSDITATDLVGRIHRAAALGYSGEVRTQGSVQIPLAGATFGGVARLLGERTDLRVWWRDADNWRIDRLRTTGESDLVRDGGLSVRWNYETNKVTFTPYSAVRLPDDVDALPGTLAARLLAGAQPAELSRLAAQRIAGRTATGVRLVPSDSRSTISRVDIWADESSGLPLRVRVYGEPAGAAPILSTELISLTLEKPVKELADFRLSSRIDFSRGVSLDAAAGANAFAPFLPPDSVAGLARSRQSAALGAVGVYGRGPTALLAVPLRDSVARQLRDQLERSSNSSESDAGLALAMGPLSVLLAHAGGGHFLLAGTVTPATLETAAGDLAAGVVRTR